jgi:chromosome segregation ATPase
MKISSLLREAPKGPALSLDNDLMQRAMLRFPGYDSQQALSLYIADKAVQQQKTDAAQNNLINTQQNAIKSIGQELQDYEAQAQETDREVERLKQLSGTLTTGSADRQQKAKVSADELEKLQKDLEELKTKPGMDPEKYKEIEQQISALANSSGAEDADVKKLQNLVNNIQNKANVNYEAVAAQLEKTKQDLDSKEERFKKYVKDTGDYKATTSKELEKMAKTSAAEIKKYSDIVDAYKQNIDTVNDEIKATTAQTKNDAEEARKVLNIIKSLYNNAKDSVDPNALSLPVNQQAANDQEKPEQTNQQGQQLAPLDNDLLNQYKGKNINVRAESVQVTEYEKSPPRIYKDWGDPKFNTWMKDHLTILINLFKGHFKNELARKNPTYGDGQISYDIQEEAWYLKKIFDGDDPILTKKKMDAYLDLVKMTLFSQPVEISQQDDLPLRESLHKTYEHMLDNLIGLPYIKG